MRVILLKDIPGLGATGAVKDVKEGYARNYLLPRGLAAEATEGGLRALEGQQKAQTERARRQRVEAARLVATLEKTVIEIAGRGGEGGKLFGSITAQDIADALTRRGMKTTKKQVELDEPIKLSGFYTVPVRVAPGIVARVEINVVTGK